MTRDFHKGSVRVLLAIREGATSWEALCARFGLDPLRVATREMYYVSLLKELGDSGVIDIEPKMSSHDAFRIPSGRFQVSAAWTAAQAALGISLTTLAALDSYRSMVVRPYFDEPERQDVDLFVAMPFAAELQPVYEDHIRAVASGLGLSVMRADDFFTSHTVISDVWRAIYSAKAVVADCTGRNPNVFYEIGLAHAIGTPVVLIAQAEDDVPFDIRHLRYLRYSLTPRGMKEFEQKLDGTIRETIAEAKRGTADW